MPINTRTAREGRDPFDDIAEIRDRLDVLETSRRLTNSSIRSEGLRIFQGGSLNLEDGGNITVNDGGDVRVLDGGNITVEGGDLVARDDGGDLVFRVQTSPASIFLDPTLVDQLLPQLSGTISWFAGSPSDIPDTALHCNGQEVNRDTYARLFNAIGTTWGSGNGSTTFNVPDLRGRMFVGAGSGGFSLGDTGGSQTHDHSVGDTGSAGSHSHGSAGSHGHGSAGSHDHTTEQSLDVVGVTTGSDAQVSDDDHVHNVVSDGSHSHGAGGSHSHGSDGSHDHTVPDTGSSNNMPPYAALTPMIRI